VLLAVGGQVGHDNLYFASRMNKAVVVFVRSVEAVDAAIAAGANGTSGCASADVAGPVGGGVGSVVDKEDQGQSYNQQTSVVAENLTTPGTTTTVSV